MDFFFSTVSPKALWQGTAFAWEALHRLAHYLLSIQHKIEIEVPSNVFLEKKELISIGKGTTIDPGVLIQGPCIIGENCTIRHGAFLRPFVILGSNCSVGHGTEIKHSIFLNHATASHLCYVGDSILGQKVNLGAGVKCANLRFDHQEVVVSWNGQKVATRLKKMGAILGDGANVGCNCVLNPGTLLGKECMIHPLLNVGGTIAPKGVVKAERNWQASTPPESILGNLLQS